MNPVVFIRSDNLALFLGNYITYLRRYGKFPMSIAQTVHWEAQRLRSVCERELGTRDR